MTRRDPSGDDMTYACRLANQRDTTEEMIFRALATKPSGKRGPGSVKYQRLLDTRGLEAADKYARRTAQKAIKFVKENPRITDRASATVKLVEIEAASHAVPWGLYGGAGARRALEAAFVVAERTNSLRIGFALREWAEIAGKDMRELRSNRDLLVALNWLRRNPNDRPGRTGRYGLRIPSHIHSHGRYECANQEDRLWLAHDAFRPDGLGDDGWYVLSMTGSSVRADDLAFRCGYHLDDLEAILARLERAAVVICDDDGGVRRVSDLLPGLDREAARSGTVGAWEADSKRHTAERVDFRARLERVGQDVNVRGVRT